ncbi:hypothetical protein TNCT_508701 [Trichonephila clavata]|uniref:Uncharacterized protein n=1 Tax=Trichonephila clavata TaxID=2740835 RepID=A0A8X6FX24_TRICU|nr:hypothetical protein TNCT_508701 [Trichonephila clavata]
MIRPLLRAHSAAPSGFEQHRIVTILAFPSNDVEPIAKQFVTCPGVPSEYAAQSYAQILSVAQLTNRLASITVH